MRREFSAPDRRSLRAFESAHGALRRFLIRVQHAAHRGVPSGHPAPDASIPAKAAPSGERSATRLTAIYMPGRSHSQVAERQVTRMRRKTH
jgi:hypothetical protein